MSDPAHACGCGGAGYCHSGKVFCPCSRARLIFSLDYQKYFQTQEVYFLVN
jgi:hypothetical protein